MGSSSAALDMIVRKIVGLKRPSENWLGRQNAAGRYECEYEFSRHIPSKLLSSSINKQDWCLLMAIGGRLNIYAIKRAVVILTYAKPASGGLLLLETKHGINTPAQLQ